MRCRRVCLAIEILILSLPQSCLCFLVQVPCRHWNCVRCLSSLHDHTRTLHVQDEFAHLVDSHPMDDQEPCLPPRPVTQPNPYKIPTKQDDQWEWFYSKLKSRKSALEHGPHTNIIEEALLRNWIAQQRKSFMKTLGVLDLGEKDNWGTAYLSRDRKQRLDALNFPWGHLQPPSLTNDFIYSDDFQRRVRIKYKDWLWTGLYDKLKTFKSQYGHTRVPIMGDELGAWTAEQRKIRWTMPERRRLLLDRLQFDWEFIADVNNLPPELQLEGKQEKVSFATRLKQLKEYRKTQGDCNVPKDSELGKWMRRMQGRRSKLSPSTIQKLEMIGLVFDEPTEE